jgi:AcrR family transcriptional regulator
MANTNSKSVTTRSRNRYEKRLSSILKAASKIIARDGYEGASVRDVAARSGIGLSGIYYYFKSKDELLFAIQHNTFTTLVDSLKERIDDTLTPEERLKIVIDNHFRFFVSNMDDLKVCVHEIESLSGKYYKEVLKIRREYFNIVRGIVAGLYKGSNYEKDLATLFLFGSLNWSYMWFDPKVNTDISKLSSQFLDVFLNGIKS